MNMKGLKFFTSFEDFLKVTCLLAYVVQATFPSFSYHAAVPVWHYAVQYKNNSGHGTSVLKIDISIMLLYVYYVAASVVYHSNLYCSISVLYMLKQAFPRCVRKQMCKATYLENGLL
jgi:hypothetical protein